MTLRSYLEWWKGNLRILVSGVKGLLPTKAVPPPAPRRLLMPSDTDTLLRDIDAGIKRTDEIVRRIDFAQRELRHTPVFQPRPIEVRQNGDGVAMVPASPDPPPPPPPRYRSPKDIFVARGDRWFCRDKGHPIHGFAVVSQDPPYEYCRACPYGARFKPSTEEE